MKSFTHLSFLFLIVIGCDEIKNSIIAPPTKADINGKVLCLNPGLGFFSDAEIILQPLSLITYSNYSGDFEFSGLEPAAYTLIISLQGYYSDTLTIDAQLGENNIPSIYLSEVPPQLVKRFSATRYVDEILLHWTTETETTNQGFEIQKSNGGEFITIAFVEGAGTTEVEHDYYYYDSVSDTTANYFRLKQISFNGSVKFSFTIKK